MTLRTKFLTSTTIGLLTCLNAAAETPPGRVLLFHDGAGGKPFAKLDIDGDGAVSRAEFEAADAFAKLDKNQDGQLDQKDMSFQMRMPTPPLLIGADDNRDRSVSREEWSTYLDDADQNDNLELSWDELRKVLPVPPEPPTPPAPPAPPHAGQHAGRGHFFVPSGSTPGAQMHMVPHFGPGASWQPRGEGAAPISLEDLDALFLELDVDADGVITEKEWPSRTFFFQDQSPSKGSSTRRE